MSEDSIHYESYKEERDLILEYNQVAMEDVNIVNICGIGIDNMTRSQAIVKIMNMIKDGGVHHVICMNPYKLHRMKTNADLKLISNKAALRLPSGAGLEWAASLLKTPLKERIDVLSLMMDIVRISEIKNYTLFFVGGRPEITEHAFFNIKKSFPKIRIVGRHGGFFNPEREKSVIEAIRKSEANIVFVGLGFPKEERWIYSHKNEFKNTIFISIGGSIDIISGEIKKAPPYFMQTGLDWFYRIISKPWRIGRLFRTALFFLIVIKNRLFMKK